MKLFVIAIDDRDGLEAWTAKSEEEIKDRVFKRNDVDPNDFDQWSNEAENSGMGWTQFMSDCHDCGVTWEIVNIPEPVQPNPNPDKAKITINCGECGSREVARDANARWSDDLQDWELTGVYDQGYCDDCGEVSLKEKPLAGE